MPLDRSHLKREDV